MLDEINSSLEVNRERFTSYGSSELAAYNLYRNSSTLKEYLVLVNTRHTLHMYTEACVNVKRPRATYENAPLAASFLNAVHILRQASHGATVSHKRRSHKLHY